MSDLLASAVRSTSADSAAAPAESPSAADAAPALVWREGEILRRGRPHRILSGAVHYFRVHPEQWEDRLRRLAAAYLREHGGHRGPVRVDVVGVLCRRGRPPQLRHVVGVGS